MKLCGVLSVHVAFAWAVVTGARMVYWFRKLLVKPPETAVWAMLTSERAEDCATGPSALPPRVTTPLRTERVMALKVLP